MDRRRSLTVATLGAAVALAAGGVWLWTCRGKNAQEAGRGTAGARPTSPRKLGGTSGGEPPATRRLERDDDPPGSLRFEGQVLGPEDAPIGGAIVTLSSVPPRRTTSEKDGSFSFDRLIGRTYSVRARAGDLVGGPVIQNLRATSDPIVIRLARGVSIDVEVVAADDGKPIAGATATVDERDGDDDGDDGAAPAGASATTDATGHALLRGVAPGTWTSVLARAPGYAPGDQLVQIPSAPGATARTRVELRRGAAASGLVVNQRGEPVAGAQVSANDVSQMFDASDGDDAQTDARGRFSFPALAAGTYRFSASHRDYASGSSDPITLDGATAHDDLRIQLAPGALAAGRVIDASGAPSPWATVRIGDAHAMNGTDHANRQIVAGQDGAFEVKNLPHLELLALALSDDASSPTVPVDLSTRSEVRGIVLRLDLGGRIAGQVVDGAGEPVPEVQVVAFPDVFAGWLGADFSLRGPTTDATDGEGRFELRGLPQAEFRLVATRQSLATGNPFNHPGAKAKTGDTRVRIVLEADGGVRGQVQLDAGGAPGLFTVTVSPAAPAPFAATDGRFEIPSVPPGKKEITIRGPEFTEVTLHEVQVAGGQVRDLGVVKVQRGRSVSGHVRGRGGAPVAGATVVLGKTVLGDGKSVSASAFGDMLGTRRTTTDASGAYRINGIGRDERLLLVAEHVGDGRSQTVPVAAGTDSPTIDLQLLGVGGVAGKVTAGGKPAASSMVTASPVDAQEQISMVRTGDDGSYRIENLVAGSYKVTGIVGAGLAASMAARTAAVAAGRTAQVDLDIPIGSLALTVAITPKGAGTIDAAQVFLFDSVVVARNGKELTAAFNAAAQNGGAKMAFAMGSMPAKFDKVVAGTKSVCVIPVSGDLGDPALQKQLRDNANLLKVYCSVQTVAPSPAEQRISIAVPPMEPLPKPPPSK